MPQTQGKTQAATDLLSRISEFITPADMKLDQVKKSVRSDLDRLKSLEQLRATQNVAAALFERAETGFKKDLDELGIRGDGQKEYLAMFSETWARNQMDRKSHEILNSPELAAMDAFITDLQNLPKLKELIANAKPQAGWQGFMQGLIDKVPGLSSFPGLKDFLSGGALDTILTAVGLGGLISSRKKEQGGKEDGKSPASTDRGSQGEKKESREAVRKTPKSTVFIGDSITVAMESQCRAQGANNPLKIEGKTLTVAKGGMDARWGIGQIRQMMSQKDNPLKDMENAVVLYGTNDIGVGGPEGTADKIFGRLEELYRLLREAGVKHVYAVTVPPYEGYGSYDRRPEVNKRREALNQMIRGEYVDPATGEKKPKSRYIYYVMDSCRKESEGGLADNNNPNRLCKAAYGNGDWLHIDKPTLGRFYQNHLEIGTGMAEENKSDQLIA